MANKKVLLATLATATKNAEKTLKSVRDALAKKDLTKYNTAMATLQKDVQEVNKMRCKVEYCKFLETDTPMIAAVRQFYINKQRVKETRSKDDGSITGVNLEDKKARIDLEDFCDFGELPKKWTKDAAHLLAKLVLRETNVFAIKPSELSAKSFYFIHQVRAKQEGKTPDSNTQIVRLLQTIIDEMVFVDNGEGKNAYKCTSHDLAFIHDAVTKMDAKEKCTIATMNERQFKTVLMSVLAHCLGEAYKVKAVKIKEPKA